MNQSVISRMNLIMDMDEPDVDTLTERTMKVTGCTDKSAVADMAASIQEISERCRETMITDGSCGVRELISWVQSFMVCGNIMEAAKYTVLSSVSSDPETAPTSSHPAWSRNMQHRRERLWRLSKKTS